LPTLTLLLALTHHIASSVECSIITYKNFIKENLQPLYTTDLYKYSIQILYLLFTSYHIM